METTIYDAIIVGDGPAAVSAALNLKIRNKTFLLMGNSKGSNKVNLSPVIDNYLGLPAIRGSTLMTTLINHATQLGVQFSGLRANQIFNMGSHYITTDTLNAQHQSKTVIVATGVVSSNPIQGEEQFLGRGVSYCATCDGHLYRNKIMVVLGQNDESVLEANFLATLAAKIYFIPLKKINHPLDASIEVLNQRVQAIKGETVVTQLELGNGTLPCDVVFILRDAVSPAHLVPGLQHTEGHIVVNALMQTNFNGLFAAGDCTGKPYALMKAVGQGQTAALNTVNYIDNIEIK